MAFSAVPLVTYTYLRSQEASTGTSFTTKSQLAVSARTVASPVQEVSLAARFYAAAKKSATLSAASSKKSKDVPKLALKETSSPKASKPAKSASSPTKAKSTSTKAKKMDISEDDDVIEVTPKVKKTGTVKRTTAASATVASSEGSAKPAKRSAKILASLVISLDAEGEALNATKKSGATAEELKKPRGRPAKKTSTEDAAVAKTTTTKRVTAKKASKAKAVSDEDDDLHSLPKRPSATKIFSDNVEEIGAPTKKRGRPKMTTSKESEKDDIVIDLTLAPATKKRAAKTTSSTISGDSGAIHKLDAEEPKAPSRAKKTTASHSVVDVLPEGDEFILNNELVELASAELRRDHTSVRNALTLLKDGNTVPFITRYRKEMIGEMDETHVRAIHKLALQYTALQQRKHTVLETIKGLNKLTPELEAAVLATTSMRNLEDIYAPYKPKKNSLADQAIAKGLGEIADTLLKRSYTDHELTAVLNKHINAEKGLKSLSDVMLGVQHIWAEKVSDSVRVRDAVRPIYAEFGTIATSENPEKLEEEARIAKLAKGLPSRKRADTYAYYFGFSRSIANMRSHNVMAVNRGEREKFLKVKFSAPEPDLLTAAAQAFGHDHRALDGLINLIVAHFAVLQPGYATDGVEASTTSTAATSTLKSHPHKSNASDLLKDILSGNKKPKKPVLDEEDGVDEDWTPSVPSKATSSDSAAVHSGHRNSGPPSIEAGAQTMHTNLISDAILDGFKRLLHPSMIKEARNTLTEMAENDSIVTFGRNLKSLLLRPPVAGHTILGIDPGFTHGCKLCVIDEHGKVMDTRVIFPFVGESKMLTKLREFDGIVRKFNISLIAIGNGTAHKETINFVKKYKKEANTEILWCLVDESGASVYSVSPEAQAEFPNLDPAGRGAASIARRTLDPMAEIVKIPTQSIGVGSYQHDVNQKELERSLSSVVEDCVNYVGVNLNTASQPLLRRVSGLTSTQAQNIVAFRDINGGFNSRTQLTKVKGIGPKTYTQCAGFLRLPESLEPLDNTGIHPESYPHATSLLKTLKFTSKDIVSPVKKSKVHQALEKLDLKTMADKLNVGLPTLTDIIADLKKPGRDPRATAQIVQLDNQIAELEQMKVGMSLLGRVVNVTGFGAFVDVGIEVSGLVLPKDIIDPITNLPADHSSMLAISPGYVGDFEVLSIDVARRRYGLRVVLRKEGSPVLM